MADNTRINEIQNKLLQAMDIVNAQALSGISFDKTIVCMIEDDSYRAEGKYIVTDGSKTFIAYSDNTKLRNKANVYITIPQGDYNNQKIIIGEKTDEIDKPFVFTNPLETMFDMTDNAVSSKVQNGALIANALNKYGEDSEYEYITICDTNCEYYGYTRLGIKANFKSWIKNAVCGEYGVAVILTVDTPNVASGQEIVSQDYYYTFSNKDMYGNTYNFETEYEQQIVILLDEIQGTITNIKINFYQKANFFDKFNEPLLCSQNGYIKEENTNLYLKDEDGDYMIDKENDVLLEPNLFVNNFYLCFGYDISKFSTDYVEVYTQQSNTYKHSNQINNNGEGYNKKLIKLRWLHINDGVPIDMSAAADKETHETPYEIRWYRYQVGAVAADPYCGVYWTRIDVGNTFELNFIPDINLQQEKIKAIIIYDSSIPYRSNELYFENEEDLPPSLEAQHIMNALTIIPNDNSNGNYMLYGQDGSIKDTIYGKQIRYMTAWFDTNGNGELENNEKINEDQSNNIEWYFPAQNSMIELIDENKIEIISNDNTIVGYKVFTHEPRYTIANYYSPNKINNTITCKYTLNNRVYTTEKAFTFGPAGTMGTNQTLVIDFIGDMNAVNMSDNAFNTVGIKVQLYDNQNIEQQIPDGEVIWQWYYNSALESNDIKFPLIIEGQNNNIIHFSQSDFDINHLYILQATVGKLTTYFSIPIQNGDYSYIKGPTQVIYQANGEPAYSRESYDIFEHNSDLYLLQVEWEIIHNIDKNDPAYNDKVRYIGALDKKTNKLQPLSIYTKDAPIYGVQAYEYINDGENIIKHILWTQPILVLQNQWPNGVINEWDGKSLVLDEKNSLVLATAMAAGKKNDDNTFSGVMIGDWEEKDSEESLKQTGVYGFHHGAMSYAFKEDGTAFLGKDRKGRIVFNGNDATIYSQEYEGENPKGIKIDLNEPYFIMSQNGGNSELKADKYSTSDYPFQIGSKFKVQWDGTIYATNGQFSGHIDANSGRIGNWTIIDGEYSEKNPYAGALKSNDSNIILNTQDNGSIIIGDKDNHDIRIIISAGYDDDDEQIPSQITMGNNSVIHGGIIRAGTLQSNNSDNRINLSGYMEVLDNDNRATDTFLGYVQADTDNEDFDMDTDGIGFGYAFNGNLSKTTSVVKATSGNVGMSFRNGGWISIDSDGINISGKEINFIGVSAGNQNGIYARFA